MRRPDINVGAIHEAGHAIDSVVLDLDVSHVMVRADGSGVTCLGPDPPDGDPGQVRATNVAAYRELLDDLCKDPVDLRARQRP